MKKTMSTNFKSFLLCFFCTGIFFAQKPTVERDQGAITIETIAEDLEHPWALAFLPDDRLLITERAGTLRVMDTANNVSEPIQGVPEVFAHGQGGMLDVALDPDFEQNNYIYLTYAEPGADSTATTALGRGVFKNDRLEDFEVIFRMEPVIEGDKHFGGRIVFTDEGHILLTLAERFQFDPAQDNTNHMGTIVRINRDGTVPDDNPFVNDSNSRKEIWSYGHRNIESAAIDPKTGNLWVAEMGPMGGDEFNLAQEGKNYGWPIVSWGRNYDGSQIPDHDTRPEFEDAVIVWTPTISPSGMIFYDGEMYPEWQDHAIIGGLTSSGIVIVKVDGEQAEEIERVPVAERVRDVALARDGSIFLVTDHENGKVLRLNKME
ncbi:MAG TPA: PQQ-dependent sugar dehydrogenase [Gillisia sp.]|nr:PQQ-dependent sugar dehydrogenase [Gillisia sp.]